MRVETSLDRLLSCQHEGGFQADPWQHRSPEPQHPRWNQAWLRDMTFVNEI